MIFCKKSLLVAAVILASVMLFLSACASEEPVDLEPILDVYNVANYKQFQSDNILGVVNGKLYMFSNHKLLSFQNGKFRTVKDAGDLGIAIVNGQCIYQKKHLTNSDTVENADEFVDRLIAGIQVGERGLADVNRRDIYSYDPITEDTVLLGQAVHPSRSKDYCTSDGTLYVFENEPSPVFHLVRNKEYIGTSVQFETYEVGENIYSLELIEDRWRIVRSNADGNRYVYEDLPYIDSIEIIPYGQWLLIHYGIAKDVLYIINGRSGEITHMFSAGDYRAKSAVNIHDGYVYLSLARYSKKGFINMEINDNDPMNGTYRIRLEDGNREKISDDVYFGLYIFDNTSIFGCRKDGVICKLDFDGKLIAELPQE